MNCFVDTSAIYALLDANDEHHAKAAKLWEKLLNSDAVLHSSNYVALECHALVQRRLGAEALSAMAKSILTLFITFWIDEALHMRASKLCAASMRKEISLVDWTSFEIMREKKLQQVFAFDRHFAEQGFEELRLE